jgi:hypothetical protein
LTIAWQEVPKGAAAADQLGVNGAHDVRAGDPAAARAEPVRNRGGSEKRKAAAPAPAPAATSDVDGADGGAPPKKKRGRAVGAKNERPEERQRPGR